MARVVLLSNPRSTGNRAILPRIRSFCARHSDVFHYEVEDSAQIGAALRTIARVQPVVIVVNGGDGTVQTVLTELHNGAWFGDSPPPIAVLPNGKTNLIAADLGAAGEPIAALERVLEIARTGVARHIVERELISLSSGDGARPVLGMFLGGAGLADTMLYCRNKLYPLGIPNGLAHAIAAAALFVSLLLGISAAFLPPRPRQLKVSLLKSGQLQGRFSILVVTTLQRLVIGMRTPSVSNDIGSLKLLMVDHRPFSIIRAIFTGLFARNARRPIAGVHLRRGEEIHIEGGRPSVYMDGELFQPPEGRAIVLTQTRPMPFLRLAA